MGRRPGTNPKTYSLRISSEAHLEIRDIYSHIAYENDQPINALKVYSAIRNLITQIAQTPFAFKECKEIPTVKKMYRRANCYSWSIIYKISGEEIIILGVIHQAQKNSRIRTLRKRK